MPMEVWYLFSRASESLLLLSRRITEPLYLLHSERDNEELSLKAGLVSFGLLLFSPPILYMRVIVFLLLSHRLLVIKASVEHISDWEKTSPLTFLSSLPNSLPSPNETTFPRGLQIFVNSSGTCRCLYTLHLSKYLRACAWEKHWLEHNRKLSFKTCLLFKIN